MVPFANPCAYVVNADSWVELGRLVCVRPEFTAVEIKALYVIGLLDEICKSVECLLAAEDAWPSKYLPAYSLFASAVDLFGRCLTGNSTPELNSNLAVGFFYLKIPTDQPPENDVTRLKQEDTVVVCTNHFKYTISDLVALRHFSAHGQATAKKLSPGVDNELLGHFPDLMDRAIETYWAGFQNNTEFCERMGRAKVGAYGNRAKPLKQTALYFSKDGNTAGSLFRELNWNV